MKKIFVSAALLMGSMLFSANASAAVIEHQADRYVINVDQMDLNGEETVLDVLMMLPDVITIDGQQAIYDSDNSGMNGIQQRTMGHYAVRVDNMNIMINPEVFMKNTKAKEIKCIKVCVNPGVQKGCWHLKQVIDIYYRKHDKGNDGRVKLTADSYGKGQLYATDLQAGDNYQLHTYAVGALDNRKHDCNEKNCGDVNSHGLDENLRAHLNWDITDKDNMIITGVQTFSRAKDVLDNKATYARTYDVADCYTRDLGNGAYAMFQGEIDYNHNNTPGVRTMSTNPYGLIELGAPFISNKLYLNGGVESGYSASTAEQGGESVTDKSRYEDIYAQLDWNPGKFHFSVGDRVRFLTQYYSNAFKNNIANHTATANHVTVTSWLDINDYNTVQATFARRFHGPNMSDVTIFQDGDQWKAYVNNITESPIYTAEMRYTFQKKDFNLMGIVKNVHVNNADASFNDGLDHDNILQVGASAWFHVGILRCTVGFDYNWQKSSFVTGTKYNNFVNLKLVPQVTLKDGWRFMSTLLYNSRKAYDSEFYTPANFYAEVGAEKQLNKNWLVEAKFHDMAGQHTGNRAVTIGGTYSF